MKEIKFNTQYQDSLLCNFAAKNLYSIILDKNGPFKRRLFIHISDDVMDIVPIHSHKYIDEMEYLFGHVEDFCYKESNTDNAELLNEYTYTRLNEEYKPLSKTVESKSFIIDKHFVNETHKIYAHHLHTVKIKGISAWIINELSFNPLFYKYEGKCYYTDNIDGSELIAKTGTSYDYEVINLILENNGIKLVPDEKYSKSIFNSAEYIRTIFENTNIKVKGYIKKFMG